LGEIGLDRPWHTAARRQDEPPRPLPLRRSPTLVDAFLFPGIATRVSQDLATRLARI
jgi:hypothetical protein